MASSSESPRSRIDQFFPSRKRKPAKGEKANNETKNPLDVSPSAKGSLAGYLIKSPSTTSPSAHLVSDRGTPLRHDPIKRNLTREINLSLDFVRGTTCADSSRGGEVLEKGGEQKGLPHDGPVSANQLDECSYVANGLCDDALSSRGNSELNRFATDFLSLYCSDVPSTEEGSKGQKRNHSPPNSAPDNKACSKKHCIVVHNISPPHVGQLPVEGCHELANLLLGYNAVKAADTSPRELDENTSGVGVDLNRKHAVFTCLRKCVNTSKSNLNKAGFHTPGSAANKFGSNETPESGYKCSMFSPGEEFWNEAIQVVDGLLAPTDSRSLEACPINNEGSTHNMCAHESGGSTNKCADARLSCNVSSQDVKKLIKPFGNAVENEQFKISVCSKLIGSNAEESNTVSAVADKTETSPLPVKHFDFFSDERKDVTSGHSAKLDSESVNVRGQKNSDAVIHRKHLTDRNHSLGKNDLYLYQTAREGSGNLSSLSKGLTEVKYVSDTFIADVGKGSIKDDPNPLDGDVSFATPISDPSLLVKKHEDSIISNRKNAEASTPSSNLPLKDSLQLQNWLPPEICCIYSRKGITKLYPWQVDCLQVDGVLERRNLVYCASTSAGKSFVAEILMLRRVMQTGKMAILVLPYVSICAEKTEHLEALLEPLGKHVRSFYGNQGGGSFPKDTSVAVCTIEKANSLVNKLLEEGRLSEVGIIVIDELHMVGDQHRGYLLELLLTKLRYASGEGSSESSSGNSSGSSTGKSDITHGLQIVGMSATMPNVGAVADWLQAALYQTEFRPVPLEEYIKVGNSIFNKKLDLVRTISKTANFGGKDPDHIVELCNEIVLEGHSVLLFCSSRKGCESTARHISKFITKTSLSNLEPVGEFCNAVSAIEALRRCPAGLDPILEATLPSGVAYHHAGLTVEEREIVETCYRKGIIHVLTATSTLAAGVNLPARRVIFRQPRIGRDFIDGTRYRQMAGRAGRTGIDTKGESILICKPEEVKKISGILNDSCPPLQSCLSDDKNGMTHAILEVVAGGIVQTASDIHRYVRCTLLNSTKPFEDVVKSAQESLCWLCHNKFLEWNEENKLYKATPLGRAAFGSSLCPEESLIVLDDLSRAREGFVLASDLHLVYLVTPINVDIEPDWELYYGRFMELSVLDQSVGNRVGVLESFLMRRAHGAAMNIPSKKNQNGRLQPIGNNCLSEHQALRVSKRFYVALMLSRLVQEIPIADVCVAFKVARGMIQSLQENAGRFASMVSMFCERLGWHDLEGLISKFQNRVSFGVRAEIVELTTIPYVKGSRARALYKAGLRTPLAIAEASTSEIAKALFDSSLWTTEEGSAMRRIQLGLAKKIKNGARKIIFEKAEEAHLTAFSAFRSLGVEVPQISVPLLSTKAGEGKLVASAMQGQKNRENDGVLVKAVDGSTENITLTINAPTVANIELSGTMDTGPSHANPNLLVGPVTCDSLEEWNKPSNEPVTSSSADLRAKDSAHVTIQKGKEHEETKRLEQNTPGHSSDITCPNKGPINAGKFPGGFDSFMDQWEAVGEFYFDVHFSKRTLHSSFCFEIFGLAICWNDSPVYYINLSKDLTTFCKQIKGKDTTPNPTVSLNNLWEMVEQRWKRITKVMGQNGVRKITWNLKTQIQVLGTPGISIQRFTELRYEQNRESSLRLIDKTHLLFPSISVDGGIDICLAVWILWPDEESSANLNLDKVVKKRLSNDAAAAANRDGRWRNQMHKAAHNGCCHRVSLTRALCSFLWRLLDSEKLVDVLIRIENPLVKVLADMELWGIGVDLEACILARSILLKKLKELEKEAFSLAGISFSLNSSADIAFVLYTHLKLPVPGGCIKGKQHPSTNKHSLDFLRDCHPIVPLIKEHRTLAKLLNSTLGSICSKAKLCLESQRYIIHGHWLQTSTATGRISVEDPNLQCVEHMIEFVINNSVKSSGHTSNAEHHKINARQFFTPTQENWVIVTADYSQIELRILAHFSRDASLIELLSKPDGDVFTMLAAKWTGTTENAIASKEREQTKKLVYGILYGMGANTLAEQLECSVDEAAEKILSFKSSFPGVSAWLHEAVSFCRSKGYIETLMGRRRFLSKIKFGNSAEKSKAQRQAVNSICQGSAADIIKIAMINIHSVVAEGCQSSITNGVIGMQYCRLKGQCRILLQVHDELVLEVNPSLVREAGQLLADSMETAASLLVPLRVKLKAGRTWGSLEPYDPKS